MQELSFIGGSQSVRGEQRLPPLRAELEPEDGGAQGWRELRGEAGRGGGHPHGSGPTRPAGIRGLQRFPLRVRGVPGVLWLPLGIARSGEVPREGGEKNLIACAPGTSPPYPLVQLSLQQPLPCPTAAPRPPRVELWGRGVRDLRLRPRSIVTGLLGDAGEGIWGREKKNKKTKTKQTCPGAAVLSSSLR